MSEAVPVHTDVTPERIGEAQRERETMLMRAQVLQDLAEKRADGDMTGDEKAQYDGYVSRVKALDGQIERARELESLQAAKAVPAEEPEKIERVPARRIASIEASDDDGLLFAQMAVLLHGNGHQPQAAAEYARHQWHDEKLARILECPAQILRADPGAGDTVTATWAAEIATYRHAAELFIEFLRSAAVMMRIPMRELSFNGQRRLDIPRQDGASASGYVGEGLALAVQGLLTGLSTMTPKKAGHIMVITNELASYSNPAALALVRDDMVEGIGEAIDARFTTLQAVSAAAPAGIFNGGGSGSGTATGDRLDRITIDVRAAEQFLDDSNIPRDGSWRWIMNTQEYNDLKDVRDGVGQYAFRTEVINTNAVNMRIAEGADYIGEAGSLNGHPIVVSNRILQGNIGLVAGRQILHALGRGVRIDMSQDASIHMEDTAPDENIGGSTTPVQSMFQTDAVASRAIFEHDYIKRHANASYLITTADWNTPSLP